MRILSLLTKIKASVNRKKEAGGVCEKLGAEELYTKVSHYQSLENTA